MNDQEFMIEVENSHNRSKRVLLRKAKGYTTSTKDRLEHFYRAGMAQGINPCEALMGMATKHLTVICDMAKDPTAHRLKDFNERITDLRNYTYLLDALLRDIGIE